MNTLSRSSFFARIKLALCFVVIWAFVLVSVGLPEIASARTLEYDQSEVAVYVNPGEPTQIRFPGTISGGFKKKKSSIALDRKQSDLIVFANEAIASEGEAIIVRLNDGRSYSLRIQRAGENTPPRDDVVQIDDLRSPVTPLGEEEEEPPFKERDFQYAPPTQISGLMRELVLHAEFAKSNIPGYRVSERYKGETILNDGTLLATIEKIFIGRALWGYVLTVENQLDVAQKLNPATFRIDGTRAISANYWELSPRPLTVEQQIAGRHKSKVYIVTRAK
jgi:hypothetical protein